MKELESNELVSETATKKEKKKIGDKIKALRKEKGLTQIQLADLSGLSVNSIRLYESNKITPKFETLLLFAKVLNTPWESFIFPNNSCKFNPPDIPYIEPQPTYTNLDHGRKVYEGQQRREEAHEIRIQLRKDELMQAFNKLSDRGQREAIKRVQELGEIKKYQNR